jgi:hypothetical protein
MFPAFADLGLKIKNAALTSLTVNRDVTNPGDPDYDHLHEVVEDALNPVPDIDESIEASTNAGTNDSGGEAEESNADAGAESTGDTSDDASAEPDADPTEEPSPDEPVDVASAC